MPACNEFDGMDVVWLALARPFRALLKACRLIRSMIGSRPGWRQRHRDGIFCKAVDGGHGVQSEPIIGKAIHEPAQRLSAHRFGAIGDVAQRTQIQTFEISESSILLRQSSNAKFGPAEIVPRNRWMAHSQLCGRARKASGDMT